MQGMRFHISILVAVIATTIAGCGTTSNIQPAQKPEASAKSANDAPVKLNLAPYKKIVVLDFTDATDKSKLNPDELRSYNDMLATDGRVYADLIATKLRDTKAFPDVVRGPSPGKCLVVSGQITRLVEGNAAARFFLPGAGSSHFEATTDLVDGETGESLGHLTTDKRSWVLGGGLAATQSVQSFMIGAAEKVADQLKEQTTTL
jgi:uncharacterized protein DUF4410